MLGSAKNRLLEALIGFWWLSKLPLNLTALPIGGQFEHCMAAGEDGTLFAVANGDQVAILRPNATSWERRAASLVDSRAAAACGRSCVARFMKIPDHLEVLLEASKTSQIVSRRLLKSLIRFKSLYEPLKALKRL